MSFPSVACESDQQPSFFRFWDIDNCLTCLKLADVSHAPAYSHSKARLRIWKRAFLCVSVYSSSGGSQGLKCQHPMNSRWLFMFKLWAVDYLHFFLILDCFQGLIFAESAAHSEGIHWGQFGLMGPKSTHGLKAAFMHQCMDQSESIGHRHMPHPFWRPGL